MRVRLSLFVAALLAVGSLTAALPAAAARPPDAGPRVAAQVAAAGSSHAVGPRTAGPRPARHLKTLEAAVKAGILETAVLEALRGTGRAEATLAFQSDDIIVAAELEAMSAKDEVRTKLQAMNRGFAEQRDRVIRQIGKGVEVTHIYDYMDVVDVRITDERSLLKLLNLGDVEGVAAIHVSAPSLTQSLEIIGQPAVKAAGHEGLNTYVAVLDTGVDTAKGPALFPAGSIAFSLDTATPDDGDPDDHGHGSHVASTVLGVAPKTKILAYDVFKYDYYTECTWPDIYCNLSPDWAQKNAISNVLAKKAANWNIVAVSMSLGGGWSNEGCTDTLSFEPLRAAGIIPVVASGNFFSNYDAATGTYFTKTGISDPACIPAAIAVGSTNDDSSRSASWSADDCDASSGKDTVSAFSQVTNATNATYGPQLDILAPGSCVLAAGGYMQGTSMATPHVSGAVAVLKGSWTFPSTKAGTLNLENYLEYYGRLIADTRAGAPAVTRPRLDLGAAVRALTGTVDATPPTVGAISANIVAGTQLSTTGAVTTRVQWSATDPSGVKRFELYVRLDGGSWLLQSLPAATTSSIDYALPPNQKWEFAVKAWDGRDNATGLVQGAPLRHVIYTEAQLTQYLPIANWTTAYRTDCLGGAMRFASIKGSTATFAFQDARQVAWIATTNTDRGWAYRWVDDRAIGWVDLYSGTLKRRVVVITANLNPYAGNHSVKLWVDGTSSRSNIDVDAWVVVRNQ